MLHERRARTYWLLEEGTRGGRIRKRIGLFLAGGTYAYQAEIIIGAHECVRRGLDLVCLAGGRIGDGDPRS